MSKPGAEDPDFADEHLHVLQEGPHQLRIFHINTQSMASSFDELLATTEEYPFDIVTMSETWLKDNPLLLQCVTFLAVVTFFAITTRSVEAVLGHI